MLALVGCAKTNDKPVVPAQEPAAATAQPESIGVAWLADDGTLNMQLRAEGDGGAVGDALIQYKPGDKDYESSLRHVGGLKKGEKKPVPPWPNERSK